MLAQRLRRVFDVVPTSYKCYTNVLCLLGRDGGGWSGSWSPQLETQFKKKPHFPKIYRGTYPAWPGRQLRRRPGSTDRHFISTASCGYTSLAPPTGKLGCHEFETNISNAYKNGVNLWSFWTNTLKNEGLCGRALRSHQGTWDPPVTNTEHAADWFKMHIILYTVSEK